jgi:hypothetical protein
MRPYRGMKGASVAARDQRLMRATAAAEAADPEAAAADRLYRQARTLHALRHGNATDRAEGEYTVAVLELGARVARRLLPE